MPTTHRKPSRIQPPSWVQEDMTLAREWKVQAHKRGDLSTLAQYGLVAARARASVAMAMDQLRTELRSRVQVRPEVVLRKRALLEDLKELDFEALALEVDAEGLLTEEKERMERRFSSLLPWEVSLLGHLTTYLQSHEDLFLWLCC